MSNRVAPNDPWDRFLTIALTGLLVVEIFLLIRAPGSGITVTVAVLLVAAGIARVIRFRYLRQRAKRNETPL